MVREISLDTETTGLSFEKGDRVIEIGCVEMIDSVATENMYHIYINPEIDVPMEAVKIHGITNEFLADKPLFADIADDFLDFIEDSKLVIHNANFDMGFLNFELNRAGYDTLPPDRAIDTLAMAREMFPGGDSKSLDALCKKFGIDNSSRVLHGALLDAKLLSEVYLELRGGKEPTFIGFDSAVKRKNKSEGGNKEKVVRPAKLFSVNDEELQHNNDFLNESSKYLKKDKDGQAIKPVWDMLRT